MAGDNLQTTPAEVVPLLLAALVCDVAVADPTTQKPNLIGIFDNVNVQRFPTQRPMHFFMKVTDAEGSYDIAVRYVRVATGEMLAEGRGQLTSKSRLEPSSLILPFPPLPIPDEGKYEFQVWANQVFLGSAVLNARLRAVESAGPSR
jgi:hypothetical protein